MFIYHHYVRDIQAVVSYMYNKCHSDDRDIEKVHGCNIDILLLFRSPFHRYRVLPIFHKHHIFYHHRLYGIRNFHTVSRICHKLISRYNGHHRIMDMYFLICHLLGMCIHTNCTLIILSNDNLLLPAYTDLRLLFP